MPAAAAPIVARWIEMHQCNFKIARDRASKLGDYRSPYKTQGHRISVNYNLNQYAFLITTIHEFAHLVTWERYKHKVKPHGIEWKNNFKQLMIPFLEISIFPEDIEKAIYNHLENPAAASCSDLNLLRIMQRYDLKSTLSVESLARDSLFSLPNGRVFRKEDLVRKRYRCTEIKTGRVYLFNPLADICPLT